MVVASFVVSDGAVAGWPTLGVFCQVAGVVPRRFGAVVDPEVHAVADGDYDVGTEIVRLLNPPAT